MADVRRLAEVGRQVGVIAHDFNNLLTAINGYTDLSITALPPDNPVLAYLEEVRRAGTKASELTQRLLALSREEALLLQDVQDGSGR
jgi:signal transduction histidine kinase